MKKKIIRFGNIKFQDVSSFDELTPLFKKGGLLCFPSGPGLSNLYSDDKYAEALVKSDINMFDSGLLCLLLKTKKIYVKKYSGYKFIKNLLDYFKSQSIDDFIFIDPNNDESESNTELIDKLGIKSKHHPYIAPIYSTHSPTDEKLLDYINLHKPKYVIMNIAGGHQEKLGNWLISNATYKPVIVCTGAAIAFLTRKQAPISYTLDNLYLGWLTRCIFNPIKFVPRYLKAFYFIFIFFRYYKTIHTSNKND